MSWLGLSGWKRDVTVSHELHIPCNEPWNAVVRVTRNSEARVAIHGWGSIGETWRQSVTRTLERSDACDVEQWGSRFRVCQTCYESLNNNKVPRLSKSNGFKYSEYPKHLPPPDVITERLVSPRIPFMQIRRLWHVYGAKGIIRNRRARNKAQRNVVNNFA